MEAQWRRKLRGEILMLARRFGAAGITVEGIEGIYERAGEQRQVFLVGETLLYLADKGYVKIGLKRDEMSGVERRFVVITAAGLDLLDANIGNDPGVDIVR